MGNHVFVLTTLKFTLDDTYRPSGGIKFGQKASIGHHRLSALSPAVSPLGVEILDEVKLYDILVICSFNIG